MRIFMDLWSRSEDVVTLDNGVVHDIKSQKHLNLLHHYCVCHTKTEIHSSDTIDLLWFNVMHYSSLFQYFFSIYYGPYSS